MRLQIVSLGLPSALTCQLVTETCIPCPLRPQTSTAKERAARPTEREREGETERVTCVPCRSSREADKVQLLPPPTAPTRTPARHQEEWAQRLCREKAFAARLEAARHCRTSGSYLHLTVQVSGSSPQVNPPCAECHTLSTTDLLLSFYCLQFCAASQVQALQVPAVLDHRMPGGSAK